MEPPLPDYSELSGSLRWVTAYAEHVRKRFNSRAIVSVRADGEPVRLAQVYALEGAGLVLVEADDHPHDHEHGVGGHGGHDECPRELWIDSPGQVVFEACEAQDGELCTGFGVLGASRTPHVMVPRGTEPPAPRDHDH